MTEPDPARPGSSAAPYHPIPIPSSSRPASRASRSSLRRERERQEAPPNPNPTSTAQSPQPARPLDDLAGPSPPPQSDLAFGSFFPLVSSSTHPSQRQTTHHPTLRYIFADDDPELWTEALAHHHVGDNQYEIEQTGRGPRERAIVLDMIQTDTGIGIEVGWASSLSPDWAVIEARVSRMEGVEGGLAGAQSDRGGALMLKIEGVAAEPHSAPIPPLKTPTPEGELQSSGASGTRSSKPRQAADEYASLISDFERRMELLRRVVKAGDERQRASSAQEEGYAEGEDGT
ncbi:hypothetical protein QBC47DRAFT_386396 [Echria macrotheca]|uniref:Uncharacterized protein n=1 Tax=Echria macrotheca TaxID=438768 RepID=A0AAJ0BCR0_9PEZI|nr:hypothetical protein QBC47DRAFT_386396 [Echria macrotheca]